VQEPCFNIVHGHPRSRPSSRSERRHLTDQLARPTQRQHNLATISAKRRHPHPPGQNEHDLLAGCARPENLGASLDRLAADARQ
jgi:hypothetical protein